MHVRSSFLVFALWAMPAAVLAFGAPTSAYAEYLIQSGDVLETSVAGLPDLKQRSLVGPDGFVSIPLIAPIKASGLTLTDVQNTAKQQLSKKLFEQRSSDGREGVTAISPNAVMVSIAEYRPVYINGDVTKPGEESYRPGMTVRHAVAMAGGYEIMRFRMNNPFLESADLRSEYQTLWMQFVKQQGRIWRLTTELDGDGHSSLDNMTQAPLPKAVLNRERDIARQQLTVQIAKNQDEATHLQRAVSLADDEINLLKSRQVKDDENVAVDSDDYAKLKDFSKQGNLPMTRLSEARRLFLFSATQSLQTQVQVANTIREREEAQRSLNRVAQARRVELLEELSEANAEVEATRARLQGIGEKITYTGMIRSQLSRTGEEPVIHVFHPASGGGQKVLANEDTEIFPGDTVDVALHTEVPAADTSE